MAAAKPREQIKKRFLKAMDIIAREKYPAKMQVDVIKSIGMVPSNFYGMRGKTGLYPTLDQCYMLCIKYSVSAEWLLLGKGQMQHIEIKKAGTAELLKAALHSLDKVK